MSITVETARRMCKRHNMPGVLILGIEQNEIQLVTSAESPELDKTLTTLGVMLSGYLCEQCNFQVTRIKSKVRTGGRKDGISNSQ